MSGLSSCSLAKENEILRKDVEKTRAKLKETEFKFKNAIQEKTKLEEDYKKMEVYAFEKDTQINFPRRRISSFIQGKGRLKLNELQQELLALRNRKGRFGTELTDALWKWRRKEAIWSAKEKASSEAIEHKAKLYNREIASLSRETSEVRNDLESCRQECKGHMERLTYEETARENTCSTEKSLDVDQLHYQNKSDSPRRQSQEDQVENSKEKAKLRMRLRGTQAKLDAFRYRYKEAQNEVNLMNRQFEEASIKLKDLLALKGIEVLNLKKQLAEKGL
ncbi:hypothetical protein M0R45_030836 [Rubus argutus]|uniref:Uncharacterized protein n=1 Tax=Rubus argutus TaxID=59490 RepID=A0AAW1WBT7_RUBAR